MGMFGKRSMTPDEVADAIKNAVADATNAVTLANHMQQCERDKAEMKASQLAMHQENGRRFEELETQNVKIMRFVWVATGVAIASSAGLAHIKDIIGLLHI